MKGNHESNNNEMDFPTIPFPTARPALPPNVYVPLTVFLIVFYGLIFLFVYYQLFLIWYYKHRRFSYQTVLLFLSLIWSSLRVLLFSFYFQNAEEANRLEFALYFCLYCLPVFLQFCTFCLLILYYGQVYFKIATRSNKERNSYILRSIIGISVFIFFVSSLVSAYYSREICIFRQTQNSCNLFQITLIRVAINDLLFVIFGFILSTYLFRLAKLSMNYMIPEQNNISIFKAMLVTICTSFLLISRTLYNILAITIEKLKLPDFGFDWINVSDQADLVNLTETNKYITFVVVLFIWELIPSFVIIFLFRTKYVRTTSSTIPTQYSSLKGATKKSVFLDSNDYGDENLEEQRDLIDQQDSDDLFIYRPINEEPDFNQNMYKSGHYYGSI